MTDTLPAPADPLAAVSHPDPYPYYAALRAATPLSWCEPIRAWVAADVASVAALLQHPAARVRPPAEPVPGFLRGTPGGALFAALARMTDGPVHAAARARVLACLDRLDEQSVVEGAALALAQLADDGRTHHRDGALDAWIRRLPVTALLAAQGHPASAWGTVVDATEAWVSGLSPLADAPRQAAALAAAETLLTAFASQGITATEDAAARLAILMQPHEATAGLIGAGVLRLACDARWREAAAEGRLDWTAFAAEVLRHDPPIQNTRRVLAADLALNGQSLRAGDTVVLLLASAARDPARCEQPDTFRLDRLARPGAPAACLPLGVGAHACPGGAMALTIAICAWRHLLVQARPGDWARWASSVHWRPSLNARLACFAPALA